MTDYVKLLDEYIEEKRKDGPYGLQIMKPEGYQGTPEEQQRTAKAVYETLTGVRKQVDVTNRRL